MDIYGCWVGDGGVIKGSVEASELGLEGEARELGEGMSLILGLWRFIWRYEAGEEWDQ